MNLPILTTNNRTKRHLAPPTIWFIANKWIYNESLRFEMKVIQYSSQNPLKIANYKFRNCHLENMKIYAENFGNMKYKLLSKFK